MAHIQKIRTQRKVRAVLFQYSERKYAGPLRFMNGFGEIRSCKLLPLYRQPGLGCGCNSRKDDQQTEPESLFHNPLLLGVVANGGPGDAFWEPPLVAFAAPAFIGNLADLTFQPSTKTLAAPASLSESNVTETRRRSPGKSGK